MGNIGNILLGALFPKISSTLLAPIINSGEIGKILGESLKTVGTVKVSEKLIQEVAEDPNSINGILAASIVNNLISKETAGTGKSGTSLTQEQASSIIGNVTSGVIGLSGAQGISVISSQGNTAKDWKDYFDIATKNLRDLKLAMEDSPLITLNRKQEVLDWWNKEGKQIAELFSFYSNSTINNYSVDSQKQMVTALTDLFSKTSQGISNTYQASSDSISMGEISIKKENLVLSGAILSVVLLLKLTKVI